MRLNASGCELVVAMVERMANQSMCGVQGLAMRTQPQSVQQEHNQDAELVHVTDDDADVTSSDQPASTRRRNSVNSRSDVPLDLDGRC